MGFAVEFGVSGGDGRVDLSPVWTLVESYKPDSGRRVSLKIYPSIVFRSEP